MRHLGWLRWTRVVSCLRRQITAEIPALLRTCGGVPTSKGAVLGVPIMRTIVYGGLYGVRLVLGNYLVLHGGHAHDRAIESL